MEIKLCNKVDLFMGYILMIGSVILTLMQGRSGSAEETNQLWIVSTNKRAIKIKLAATVVYDKFYFNLKC